MSGGIIIQRYAAIKPAATDPSVYNSLPDPCKAVVDAIVAKAPADVTDNDLSVLVAMIQVAVHC
jgi:hypothetical protein